MLYCYSDPSREEYLWLEYKTNNIADFYIYKINGNLKFFKNQNIEEIKNTVFYNEGYTLEMCRKEDLFDFIFEG